MNFIPLELYERSVFVSYTIFLILCIDVPLVEEILASNTVLSSHLTTFSFKVVSSFLIKVPEKYDGNRTNNE